MKPKVHWGRLLGLFVCFQEYKDQLEKPISSFKTISMALPLLPHTDMTELPESDGIQGSESKAYVSFTTPTLLAWEISYCMGDLPGAVMG